MAKFRALSDDTIDTCSIKRLRDAYRALKDVYETKRTQVNNKNLQLDRMKVKNRQYKGNFKSEVSKIKKEVRHNGYLKNKRLYTRIYMEKIKNYRRKQIIINIKKSVSEKLKKARAQSKIKGKEIGFNMGLRKGRSMKYSINRTKAINKGRREGFKNAMKRMRKRRMGRTVQFTSVNSIVALSIIYSNIHKIVPLSSQYLALLMTIGQYDAFQYRELKEMFNSLGGDAFYVNIAYLSRYGYISKISTAFGKATWALTPLGRSLYDKLRKFIHGNYLKLNKSEKQLI